MEEYLEHNYFNTYYFSNIIDNILTGDIETVGFISEFFTDNLEFLRPFEKYSAFHKFIQYIIFRFMEEDMDSHDQRAFEIFQKHGALPKLYIDELFERYNIGSEFDAYNDTRLLKYEDIEAYQEELNLIGYKEELYEKIAEEVFYILFNNRNLLIRFNHIVAGYVDDMDGEFFDDDDLLDEYGSLFKKKGVLNRVTIPVWCQDAVYHREKGRCCLCGTDLSAVLRTQNKKHYDHMVPLFQGGINDVSNIQLLCSDCNLKKGGKDIETSIHYLKWYV